MKLKDARVLLIGASGGIGSQVCNQLLLNHAAVFAVSRNMQKLNHVTSSTSKKKNQLLKLEADITSNQGRQAIKHLIMSRPPGINVIINCAGSNKFTSIENFSDKDVIQQVNTNLVAPILLIKTLLPVLELQSKAKIVNVGSSFDSIGYPGFSVYSATKFGLRGFSESLRRELSDTLIDVILVSPRATKTQMNSIKVHQLNKILKVKEDDAQEVAKIILKSIQKTSLETYIGWPEKLFARINRIFPSIVDCAISKQLPIIKQYF